MAAKVATERSPRDFSAESTENRQALYSLEFSTIDAVKQVRNPQID